MSLHERLIKLNEVKQDTGLSRSSIYRLVKNGDFPKPVKLGERASAWLESEVNNWIADRIEQRDRA